MNTLYKKDCNTGRSEVFYPATTLDKVIDLSTNEPLDQILEKYNHIWVPFKGNSKVVTRQQIPAKLRRRGLWITYKSCANKTVTEWYNSDNFTDAQWGKNENWIPIADNNFIIKSVKEIVGEKTGWYKAE